VAPVSSTPSPCSPPNPAARFLRIYSTGNTKPPTPSGEWHNGSCNTREKPMDSGSLAGIDWGVVTLLALIAAGLVWGFVFFLRQNSKDLESLEETIESERRDDER